MTSKTVIIVLMTCIIFSSFDGEKPKSLYGIGDAFLEKNSCGYKIIGYIPKSSILNEGDTITLFFENEAIKAIVVRHSDKRWVNFNKVELFESTSPTQLIANNNFVFTSYNTNLNKVRQLPLRLENDVIKKLEKAVEGSTIATYTIVTALTLSADSQNYLLVMKKKDEIESNTIAPEVAALVSFNSNELKIIDKIDGRETSVDLIEDIDSDNVVDFVLLNFSPEEKSYQRLIFFDRQGKNYRVMKDD